MWFGFYEFAGGGRFNPIRRLGREIPSARFFVSIVLVSFGLNSRKEKEAHLVVVAAVVAAEQMAGVMKSWWWMMMIKWSDPRHKNHHRRP